MDHWHQPVKAVIDVAAIFTILGTWEGHIPAIAGILAGIWYLIQIYEWFKK